jgi:glutathione S-transferase
VRKISTLTLTLETQSQIQRIIKIWSDCRAASKESGDFLFGSFGIADCFYAPVVTRFHTYGINLSGAAADYSNAVRAWAALQEWANYASAEEASRAA